MGLFEIVVSICTYVSADRLGTFNMVDYIYFDGFAWNNAVNLCICCCLLIVYIHLVGLRLCLVGLKSYYSTFNVFG